MSDPAREHVDGYTIERKCPALRERVFDAVATVRGLRGWWTPIVTGTTVTFELRDAGDPNACVLSFGHAGLPAGNVAPGWERFLASLTHLVETGHGEPYGSAADALHTARTYHNAWTSRDFDAARHCLAEDLRTDVPLNTYPTREDFVHALTTFGSLVREVDLLAEFSEGDQALLLYDMHTDPFGTIRIAEQFTVADGLIRRIRHVHDTAALRGAG